MKHNIVILIFILSLCKIAQAQNLISNGYFEIYNTCTNTSSNNINYATGWHAAAYTPDYCNSCVNNTTFSVPYNSRGYQQDCCGGEGYAGITVFAVSPPLTREYMQTKLIDTLKTGHKYLASMYVNRADDIDYAIATMGILFTDTVINLPYPQGFINGAPQVKNTTLLADTLNWMLVQDTFIATGNEVYLTIGNFSYDSLSDTLKIGGNGTYSGFTYYYVDGVSVYDVATMGINKITNDNAQVTVYPNPNNGSMTFEYSIKEDAVLEISDLNGRLVGTYFLPAYNNQVEVKNEYLKNGVYMYRASANGHVIKIGKIIVIE